MSSAPAIRPAALAGAGFFALVVAMGIGRFAYTPALPLMLRDGGLDIGAGAWLAAVNYAGYFAGGLSAARVRLPARMLVLATLPALALLTAAMGWTHDLATWMALRFAAGVLSAWALVGASAWCLAGLAAAGRPGLAGRVYAGVGGGSAIAGLVCLALAARPADTVWQWLGACGAALAALAWLLAWRGGTVDAAAGPAAPAPAPQTAGATGLVVCYGCLGFGYILPATFIPVLGRMVIDDPALFGWAWPVFGAAAAVSTLVAARLAQHVSRVRLWAGGHLLMATGAALPALWPAPATILYSALAVGGTFMVVTMVGLQEARERALPAPTRLLGRMTSAFALGQVAGPLASALIGAAGDARTGLAIALLVSAAALAASAVWLLRHAGPSPSPSPTGVS